MGPTQSRSQPPQFFLVGLPEWLSLQNEPSDHWWAKKNIQAEIEAIDEETWRAVMSNFIRRMEMWISIMKEDIWSNCCRTGYTPVRVLIFYVTVFILIKSIFLNFCFILSIFVIVGFFLNNFQKRQPRFFLLWINSYNFFVWRPKLIKIGESME